MVLVNKLDIRDQQLLNEAESILVTSCSVKAEKEPAFKDVDFEYYKSLHKLIFGDLYDWAGTVRTINISKKGTVFCNHNEIYSPCPNTRSEGNANNNDNNPVQVK